MLFVTRKYVSEHTRWMREQQEAHPEWAAVQQEGRAIWWDRPPQDAESARAFAAAQEAPKAYPYDVNFSGT